MHEKLFQFVPSIHLYSALIRLSQLIYNTVSLKLVLDVNADEQTFNYPSKPQANQQFMCTETDTFTDTDSFCAFVTEDA